MTRLAAVDAQAFWMSAVIPSDEFLLFAFAGPPGDLDDVVAGLQRRAAVCPDLRLRIADDHAWTYPRWVPGDVDRAQFVTHPAGLDWAGCLDVVAGLADAPLDPTRMTWRLHVFPAVHGVPRAGAATVAVLQLVHALADGTRAAQLAAWLFGRGQPVPPVVPRPRGNVVVCGLAAARAQRQLATDVAAGVLPAPPGPRPSLLTNTAPQGTRRIRTLLRQRAELPAGRSVTVAALTAVGTALAGYLTEHGDDPGRLGAEVPMADIGIRHARNHFHNVGIDLRPDLAPAERADAIVDQLRAAHARAGHPAAEAQRRASAAVPAPVLRWGVRQFDPSTRSATVTGNTVVSSVNRGPADLRFGAAEVVFTAGYPALSPMMALTHGVHGIGDAIAISVHAADSAFGPAELDDYVARLDVALSAGAPPTGASG